MKDEKEEINSDNYFRIVSTLYQNKVYTFTMLGICCLLFIITAIQFWITDYMQAVLHFPEESVFLTFAIVCITAPTAGVLTGGYIVEKLGGYTERKASDICFKTAYLAAIVGLPLPLVNNIPLFIILMWLLLFFGGSIVPGLTGIMLSSIPENNKEIANSMTHFCYNLIGYLPAPFFYGVVCNWTGGRESRYGLAFIMMFTLLGIYFLHYAKKYQNLEEMEIANENNTLHEHWNLENNGSFEFQKNTGNGFRRKRSMMEDARLLSTLYGRISTKNSP
jgi:MFS family permease